MLLRARVVLELARRTSEAPEPFEGSVEPVLCDLHRQSIYWSVRALALNADRPAHALSSPGSDPWAFVEQTLLLEVAGSAEALAELKIAVDTLTFAELAVLPAEASASLLKLLRAVAVALVRELEKPKRVVEALWVQRVVRVGSVVVLALACIGITLKVRADSELSRDLAVGKPWRVSSWYGGCPSPAQECSDNTEYFFHTQEEQAPWLEIDLESPRRISAVSIDNRVDCCSERAVPLAVEISTDQTRWRTIARRETVFSTWLATFPTVEARWVRVRAERSTMLHLARVRVLR